MAQWCMDTCILRPARVTKQALRNKLLRKGVKRIVKDGGKKYKQVLKGLGLPPTYIPPEKKVRR